jgi:hypothetical protein
MPKYLIQVPLAEDADGHCTAPEWRVRSATALLRRRGVRVRLDRVVPVPSESLCVLVVEARSASDARFAADLAELGRFRIAEAGEAPAARSL